ncbi:MAG: CynX/NimT family MFS transporter [Rhodospirillales bacterium]
MKESRWGLIFLSLLIGVSAASYVGKMPPAITEIRYELSLSLVSAGWVVSIFSGIGALTGILAGVFGDSLGRLRTVLYSLLLMSVGSFLGAFSNSEITILVSRVIEGFGFIGIMAVVPSIIVNFANDKYRSLAVSLWSSVTPIGMTVAILSAPYTIDLISWRGLWISTAALSCVLIICILLFFPKSEREKNKRIESYWTNIKKTTVVQGPWLLAICFMTYTFQWMTVMVWLPTFLMEEKNYNLLAASGLAAAGVAINIFGNLFGAWLIHRGVRKWIMISFGTIIMGTTSLFIFSDDLSDNFRFYLIMCFSFFGAFQPASLIASVPIHSPSKILLSTTNGFVYQGSQLGQLLGPPVIAVVVTFFSSWELVGIFLFLGTLLNLGLAQKLKKIEFTT